MLLYRVIPDYLGGLLENGCINRDAMTTEDLFYDLGYANDSEHESYFQIETDPMLVAEKAFGDTSWEGKFFFTSPWDCLKTFTYIGGIWGNFSAIGVRIVEFDVPDEIIKKSLQGVGAYNGELINEIKVPNKYLATDGIFLKELSPEIISELEKVSERHQHEFIERIIPGYQNYYHNNPEQVERATKVVNFITKTDLNRSRFANSGVYYKCNYITGRKFTIGKYDMFAINHLLNNNIPYEEAYKEIIEHSNGILTYETIVEYFNLGNKQIL